MRRALLGLVIVVGCGDATSSPPDAPYPDAAPFVPGPNLVTLTVDYNVPFYIRYRDGEGPWTTPAEIQRNTYELHITGAYDVVALCGGLDNYDSSMLKQTFADGETAFLFCYAGGPVTPSGTPTGNVYEVDGTMKQAGELTFYDYDRSGFGPWSFSFDVPEGLHDLIAADDTNVLIRRRVDVNADMTLPAIDVDRDGTPLVAVPFTSNAEAGVETVSSYLVMETSTERAFIDGTATTIRMPPASLIEPTDRMEVDIDASTETTDRRVDTVFTGDANFTLPPKLDNIEYSYPYRQPWATWASLPPFTELELRLYSGTSQARQSVTVSASYLDATRTSYLSFYPLPGDYDVRFTIDVVGVYLRELALYDSHPGISRSSSVREIVNLP